MYTRVERGFFFLQAKVTVVAISCVTAALRGADEFMLFRVYRAEESRVCSSRRRINKRGRLRGLGRVRRKIFVDAEVDYEERNRCGRETKEEETKRGRFPLAPGEVSRRSYRAISF